MKKYIKKYNIDFAILLLIIISLSTFLKYLGSNDEFWNFANAYKIFNNYKIYKELNVIVTPLFFYIAQIIFKIFGATMFSFKIYNIIIYFTFFMLIYFVFRKLNIVRRRTIFYTLLLIIIFNDMIGCGANYNILVFIPIFINILLILKEKENDFITGILLFATFMIKQNVFVLFAIGILTHRFITRQTFKQFMISLTKIYSTAIIGIILFLVYMYMDDNLYYFIDYCFLGIKEFGRKNIYFDYSGLRNALIILAISIYEILFINHKKICKNIDAKIIKNTKVLISYGIPLLIMQYPILNYYHSILAGLLVIICIIYITEKVVIQEFKINRVKEKILYVVVIILYFCYIFIGLIGSIIEINQRNCCF